MKLQLPYIEIMNILNRAQEVIVLSHESQDDRWDECLSELNDALAKLGEKCPKLGVCAEACEIVTVPKRYKRIS